MVCNGVHNGEFNGIPFSNLQKYQRGHQFTVGNLPTVAWLMATFVNNGYAEVASADAGTQRDVHGQVDLHVVCLNGEGCVLRRWWNS